MRSDPLGWDYPPGCRAQDIDEQSRPDDEPDEQDDPKEDPHYDY